ncbi:hypothetical protein BDV19DRAFT_366530 [Aspergillus venezuelensis]
MRAHPIDVCHLCWDCSDSTIGAFFTFPEAREPWTLGTGPVKVAVRQPTALGRSRTPIRDRPYSELWSTCSVAAAILIFGSTICLGLEPGIKCTEYSGLKYVCGAASRRSSHPSCVVECGG